METTRPVKRYVDTQEAADYLGISRWTLYRLVQRREIPFIPISGDSATSIRCLVRFDTIALDLWMKKRAVTPVVAQ